MNKNVNRLLLLFKIAQCSQRAPCTTTARMRPCFLGDAGCLEVKEEIVTKETGRQERPVIEVVWKVGCVEDGDAGKSHTSFPLFLNNTCENDI